MIPEKEANVLIQWASETLLLEIRDIKQVSPRQLHERHKCCPQKTCAYSNETFYHNGLQLKHETDTSTEAPLKIDPATDKEIGYLKQLPGSCHLVADTYRNVSEEDADAGAKWGSLLPSPPCTSEGQHQHGRGILPGD